MLPYFVPTFFLTLLIVDPGNFTKFHYIIVVIFSCFIARSINRFHILTFLLVSASCYVYKKLRNTDQKMFSNHIAFVVIYISRTAELLIIRFAVLNIMALSHVFSFPWSDRIIGHDLLNKRTLFRSLPVLSPALPAQT